jgi:MacB-like periplasmic core domain
MKTNIVDHAATIARVYQMAAVSFTCTRNGRSLVMTRVFKLLFTRSNRAANLTIVLLLSFGLGAAALLSAALDRFLLHPLDVPHPETLVRVIERHPPVVNSEWFSFSLYDAMRPMHTLRDLAVVGNFDAAVSLGSGAQTDVRSIWAQMVSGDYFSMLGAAAATGRTLGPADDHTSATGVPVVLSHRFWTRAFANSQTLIGSTLTIQDKPFVIVGIMPQSFFGTRIDESPDVWLPLSAQPLLSSKSLTDPDPDRHFAILARLRSGVTLAQAQQEFAGVYRTVHHRDEPTDTGAQGLLVPVSDSTFALRDPFRHALTLLLWGLAALLLMMCANVGGLLLARTARRERDTAVRIALCAARIRRARPRRRLRRHCAGIRRCAILRPAAPSWVECKPRFAGTEHLHRPLRPRPGPGAQHSLRRRSRMAGFARDATAGAAARRIHQPIQQAQPWAARSADRPHARPAR